MDNDDKPIGKVLNRRDALKLLGTAGAAGTLLLVGCEVAPTTTASPATTVGSTSGGAASSTQAVTTSASSSAPAADCVVRPEMTEGPYFVDEGLLRSDIRSDPASGVMSQGVPLKLKFALSQIANNACIPLPNATMDIWHCDAAGVYSDVAGNTEKFLRGAQVSDANGALEFTTIYPGWYSGRAVHIHMKIRTDTASASGYEFTSQFFFDDAFSQTVYQQAPYASKGPQDTSNNRDGIYAGGGSQMTLAPVQDGDGYSASFSIALDLS